MVICVEKPKEVCVMLIVKETGRVIDVCSGDDQKKVTLRGKGVVLYPFHAYHPLSQCKQDKVDPASEDHRKICI